MKCRAALSIAFLIFLTFPLCLFAQVLNQSSTVTITATVNPPGFNPPPPLTGGGGGAGGGGTSSDHSAAVNFSGSAYPLSSVILLENGVITAQTIAGPDANFSISLNNISSGNYSFSLYAVDQKQNKSNPFSIPVMVTSGVTTNVTGIFLAPTISTDKETVKQGDFVTIFGETTPQSPVEIHVHSSTEIDTRIQSDKNGSYLYQLDTQNLELGSHTADSQATYKNILSDKSIEVTFMVSDQNKTRQKTTLVEDLNNDGKVNIIDFSIAAYWYKKLNPPSAIDLNHDGVINLIDFSIMAYYWTG